MNFPTTSWSLVLAAKQEQGSNSVGSQGAMERLCQAYWYPVYAYVRARGSSPDAALDLTQEFFLRLLDKHQLNSIEAPRGRFRWFLQTAVKHFLANEYDRARAQKRGGGRAALPLEIGDAEQRYLLEPADPATPETLFDRRWSLLLLNRAMDRVRAEHERSGKGAQFDRLRPYLVGDEDAASYRAAAEQLGATEGAVKVAVHRMRRRFGEALREEIAETVAGAEEVDAELQFLLKALQ